MHINKPRKTILDLAVSLDGFIEGINGEIDWCIMDEDMKFNDFLDSIDTIFYGRKSYDLWGEYTLDNDASDVDKEMWENVHSKKKVVFSKSITNIDNAEVKNSNIVEEVNKIKNEEGKDIWLYGGASIITTFVNLDLVDEYRLSIHPVVLGGGKPLFVNIKKRKELKLVDVRSFSSGVVQLCYQAIRE